MWPLFETLRGHLRVFLGDAVICCRINACWGLLLLDARCRPGSVSLANVGAALPVQELVRHRSHLSSAGQVSICALPTVRHRVHCPRSFTSRICRANIGFAPASRVGGGVGHALPRIFVCTIRIRCGHSRENRNAAGLVN